MKRKAAVVIFFLMVANTVSSQLVEAGLYGGLSNYSGDLSPTYVTTKELWPAYGISARLNIHRYFSIRGGYIRSTISGNDQNHKSGGLKLRNLSFRSKLSEVFMSIEFTPFERKRYQDFQVLPYVFMGGAVYSFDPRALYQGNWVDLQPLGTEGQGTDAYPQRKKYDLVQTSIPFGVGVLLKIGPVVTISPEIGIRKTFTDYLDDVSRNYPDQTYLGLINGELAAALSYRRQEIPGQPSKPEGYLNRGNSERNDTYMFFGVHVSFIPRIRKMTNPKFLKFNKCFNFKSRSKF